MKSSGQSLLSKAVRLIENIIETFCDAIYFIAAKGLFLLRRGRKRKRVLEILFEIIAGAVFEVVGEICGHILTKGLAHLAFILYLQPPKSVSRQQFFKSVKQHNLSEKRKDNSN